MSEIIDLTTMISQSIGKLVSTGCAAEKIGAAATFLAASALVIVAPVRSFHSFATWMPGVVKPN